LDHDESAVFKFRPANLAPARRWEDLDDHEELDDPEESKNLIDLDELGMWRVRFRKTKRDGCPTDHVTTTVPSRHVEDVEPVPILNPRSRFPAATQPSRTDACELSDFDRDANES